MDRSTMLRVYLFCALTMLSAFPASAAWASSRLDFRIGYDTDPGDASNQDRSDTWAALALGKTIVGETGGPLAISLDLAFDATAYSRLRDLDRISLVVTPAIDYVISPRVAAMVALVAEGQLVNDDNRSAWGWGGILRLREQLSPRMNLIEYVSYRDLTARAAKYSGTKAAVGFFLRTDLGERWMLGVGGEYAHGDYLVGGSRGAGAVRMGTSNQESRVYGETFVREEERSLVPEDEDRWSASLALDYAWSERLSSSIDYVYTRAIGEEGGENQHSVIVSTTYGF